MISFRSLVVGSLLLVNGASSFTSPRPTITSTTTPRTHSSSTALAASLVVVSPPGGVGEVTAVKAAEQGSNVRWFVVAQEATGQVVLAQEALDSIAAAGGSVELAGADVPSMLLSREEAGSAVQAVASWCGAADALVCSFDGVELTKQKKLKLDEEDPRIAWKNAIKVAAREAAKSISGTKVALISADDMEDMNAGEKSEGGGLGGLVGGLLAGGKVDIPVSLPQAMSPNNGEGLLKVRYGQIFGTPESSPNFSALMGGPRRDPELCEEYSMRTIRVDPTLSLSGNLMMGKTTRSSRHAVGEAAALITLGRVPVQPGLDVCVSSQQGTDPPTDEDWTKEFQRVESMMSSGTAAQLFSTEFGSVPDTERLADWLATKWAPAVLRTYDIAAIRTGARPVYANRAGEGKVEVVWQQLVNFDSITVGRMVIQVTDKGLTATRGPGDTSKGYGTVSAKPLAGEDVMVRLLAGAASQAIEKGLAKKVCCCYVLAPLLISRKILSHPFILLFFLRAKYQPAVVKKPKAEKPKAVAAPPTTVSSVQSFGDVAATAVAVEERPKTVTSESGPRQAGARRSPERKRRKSTSKSTKQDASDE